MTVEWFADDILEATNSVVAKVSKKIADIVMEDAKKILKSKAKTTTEKGLLNQFYVEKSKFKNGGYLVYCQGPKKWTEPYHASFLEMGTFKDEAKPFLRPALKKNRRKANKMFQDDLDSWMKTG
jgi:HK97 gp10 family phage protein